MHTEAINHDPAITFFQTGAQLAGRPSIGAWLSYGLGSENHDLPAFVVHDLAGHRQPERPAALRPALGQRLPADAVPGGQVPLGRRPGPVPLQPRRASTRRPGGGCSTTWRGSIELKHRRGRRPRDRHADRPVRAGLPDADLGPRADRPLERARVTSSTSTAPRRRTPGTFAANCLLARRLAERGVRFIQLFHRGWDQHTNLPRQIAGQCRDTDQPSAALITDLKQRGLLDETLVVWGGEFGRTVYCQGTLTADDYGRDHHPRCFTVWLAGGGIKPGITHGETDDFGYNIIRDPVHVHDLHATMLHCLGIDHTRLTFKFQGRALPPDRRPRQGRREHPRLKSGASSLSASVPGAQATSSSG